MREFCFLLSVAAARIFPGYGSSKPDSRMPDVLYQSIVPENVFLGSSVTGQLVANPWTNDNSSFCNAPPCPEGDDCLIATELGVNHVCEPVTAELAFDVKVQLVWRDYPDPVEVASETLRLLPNSADKSASFELAIPTDVESSKPDDYSSLELRTSTFWPNGSEIEEMTSQLTLNLKATDHVLVQSDKAKYKPGNTVQFRIIVLDQDLMGRVADVSYEIKSPSRNMMAQGQLASQNGVVQGRFQLDAFAEQGEWKIEVEARTATELVEESYSFDVEEYVLPKFEVTIASDNFIIKDDAEDLPFNIEAKYTFGKPVPGTMTAKLMRLPCEAGYNHWRPPIMPEEMRCPPLSDCPETDEQGCFVPPEITQTFGEFSGSEANVFPYSSINEMMSFEQEHYWCDCGNDLLMEVEVEDRYSGEVRTAQKVIKVEYTRYKMEWLYEPNLPRPDVGMKYIGKVSLIDGASLDQNGRVEVVVSSGYTYEGCERCEYEETILDIPIDAAESDGIFTVDIPEQFFAKNSFNVRATFKNDLDAFEAQQSAYHSSYRNEVTQELIITGDAAGKLDPGTTATFTIRSNYAASPTFYIVARGKVVRMETLSIAADGEVVKTVEVDSSMIPEARFLVAENLGEAWTADSVSYFVNEVLDNQVSIAASETTVNVGDNVDIAVRAAENSPVYVLGVDQSVLLLKSGNDVDQKKVLEVLQGPQEDSWRPWPIWGGCGIWFPWSYGNSAIDKINDAGLKILTVRTFQDHYNIPPYDYAVYDDMVMETMADYGPVPAADGGEGGSPMQIKTRKHFPETWLWDTVETDGSGQAQLSQVTVPDTITSWIVTAFSMSPEKGLGLDPTAEKITAFQKFFIKLYLPYSVKQNEDILVKAVIYNYLDEDVTVTATLYENEMFENLLVDGERNVRVVQIPKDEAVQVGWPIRATKIGALPIKVRAVANGNIAGDELQRVLRVKPAGQAVSQVFNGLLQNTETETLDIAFPANVVPGSQRLEIRLFGNIMANTMANIDELLKMPYGCGEQNMVNFAPAVFIYRYLAQSQKLTDEIRDKATKIIETGYQRQLKYRHNGGGFSAFGESSYNDRGASTLLSSFVLKCFRAANALLPKKAIDDQIIEDEMRFLVSKFENGNFVESGKVFSSTLMGALDKNGPVAGTAYALIALLESGVEGDVYRNVANEALATLADAVGDIEDIHTLALVTYSLTLGGHEKKTEAMEKLLGMGEQKAGAIEWLVENKYYYGLGERMSASVEVASYVLLSYAQDLPATMDDALPVFRGITRHLSESGGFKSTQDTVIGVQAMAKFAEFLVEEEMNVVVSAQLDGQNVFSSQPIRNDNSDLVVIQNLNLTDDFTLGSLSLSSLGVGSVFSQVVQHYNVRDATQDPFKLTFERVVSVVKRETDSESSPDNMCIKINTAATEDPEFRVPDGMSLLMVDHPSGFEYTSHSNEPDSEPQRVEQDGEKTTFYFDDLATEKQITICMTKTQSVANPKPIFINVQDYYNPDARSNVEVALDDQQSTELCDLCGEFCADLCGVAPSSAPAIPASGGITPPSGSLGSGWSVRHHTKWIVPPEIDEFWKTHNLNFDLFKEHVMARARDLAEQRPTLVDFIIENMEAGRKVSEKDYRKATRTKTMEEVMPQLIEHLRNQVFILKQILKDN